MTGVATLERSVGYALGCLALVAGTPSSSPTPCSDWTLLDLLEHLDDSVQVLAEAVGGVVAPPPSGSPPSSLPRDDGAARLATLIGGRARQTLGEWIVTGAGRDVVIADLVVPARAVIALGALELVVHGWDVAQACGHDRPVPGALAEELLEVAAGLVDEQDRPARFAPARPGPARPAPFDDPAGALLGFLGRRSVLAGID